jgi:hypothetical protein
MNKLDCPACSGPDNAECETCYGTSLVTQETYDTFVVKRKEELATWELKKALSEIPIENILGTEQTAIIVVSVDNTITADIDSIQLTWNEETQSWI